MRDHFQSTANSKRRVSTFLFWKNKLGLQFPVGDMMLVRTVWSSLESCKCGIKQGNGQRKVPKGSICINPYHYTPTNFLKMMKPLMGYLQQLGMHQDKVIAPIAQHLGWNGEEFGNQDELLASKGFDLLTSRVRQMVEEEGYFAAVMPASGDTALPAKAEPAPYRRQQQRQMQQQQQPQSCDYDSAYSSDGQSPEYVASDSFAPDSPPEYLGMQTVPDQSNGMSRPGVSRDGSLDSTHAVPRSPAPASHLEIKQQQQQQQQTSLMPPVPDHHQVPSSPPVHSGNSQFTFTLPELPMDELVAELAIAQQMLPLLQQRQWSFAQAQEIGSISANLIEACATDELMDMEAELAPLFMGVGGGAVAQGTVLQTATPWATYATANTPGVGTAPLSAQFSGGFDVLHKDAYNLGALSQLPGMPSADYGNMMQAETSSFFPLQTGATSAAQASAEGWTSGFHCPFEVQAVPGAAVPDVFRAYCKQCKKWGFSAEEQAGCTADDCSSVTGFKSTKVAATKAADVPRMHLASDLEVGDVVALIGKGNATFVIKLDGASLAMSDAVGIMGNTEDGTGLRVNLVGLVQVKVIGPVGPLEMIYGATAENPGLATAGPGSSADSILLGQALGVKAELISAKSEDVNLVKCLVVPKVGNNDPKVLAALMVQLNLSVTKSLKAAAKAKGDADIDAVLASITGTVAALDLVSKTSAPASALLKKATKAVDEAVIVLLSHASSKPLQIRADGAVDATNGSHTQPESQFVVVGGEADGVVQLQSATHDGRYLKISRDGVGVAGPDDEATKLTLAASADGAFTLACGSAALGVTAGKLAVVAAAAATQFSIYERVVCA